MKTELATFAGGCFWCMEKPFYEQDGVTGVVSGYIGGHVKNPSYKEVCEGNTGHTEAVQLSFNPDKVSFEKLLELFWRQIDPTDAGGQFYDRGSQYRTGIFYHSEEQRQQAELSKKKLEESGVFKEKIVTEITKATEFYPAEEYHQCYYKKNPWHYNSYRKGSGRDKYLESVWENE
jgi:methionine-S-sulfoxide reductase